MRGWRQLGAILVLPGSATLLVPGLIVSRGISPVPSSLRLGLMLPGIAFVAGGLLLMAKTIALFARVGEGTLAPWDPPRKFVVQGPYRYVRNPMIAGVMSVLLGEAALLVSLLMFEWFIAFVVINCVYMPLFEEPRLRRRFGADYDEYRRNVPRWIPRLRPWSRPPA